MTYYASRFLRAELNREMSWEYGFLKDVGQGRKISPERSLEHKRRLKEQRIDSIRLALQTLRLAKKSKPGKPEYYWLNPKTTL